MVKFMTTRHYKKMSQERMEEDSAGVADVVRLLLEDQEHRERESEERMWLMQQQMEA